jgi:hypothetical protein
MAESKTRNHIRLYRYLRAEYALTAIKTGELRVSRLKELNDPFEFMLALPYVHSTWPPSLVDKKLACLVEEYHPQWGIVSFSEQIFDPVVWSHYSDSHRGIALGFDYLLSESLLKINYPPVRPTVDIEKISSMSQSEQKAMLLRILSSKAPNWSYEQERRVVVELSRCERRGKHYFIKIPEDFLKHVVLGINCQLSESDVKKALEISGFGDATVARARRCPTRYQVLH